MNTTILALDLGTTTGWAVQTNEGQTAHGFVSFRPQRFEGGGMRYLRFKPWMASTVWRSSFAPLGHWCELHSIVSEDVEVFAIELASRLGLMPCRLSDGCIGVLGISLKAATAAGVMQ